MPVVTMVAGPNGSGKSTMIRILTQAGIDFGEYLNADDIAATLRGAAGEVSLKAQVEVRRRRENALQEGRDHSFETVLSHPSHIDHLRACKARGFEVIVYFVATDNPSINRGRVANRVVHGGHDVPADRIVNRYYRSIANLPAAIAVADQGLVFDNSSDANPMVVIAEIHRGYTIESNLPAPPPRWWSDLWHEHVSASPPDKPSEAP